MSRDRYAQCDDTCTVDCGACKGAGRPTIRRESIEDALENDRCGLCGSVDHFREDCPDSMTAAVPDPRFRDQLAAALDNHELSSSGRGGVLCRCGWAGWGQDYPAHRAGAIAAEVEARVQAAANQRAAEELRAAAADWRRFPHTYRPDRLDLRADVLDSPDHGKA
jgi:hypothetical protein